MVCVPQTGDSYVLACAACHPQVVLPAAGNVTFSHSTLTCPLAMNFVDAFPGLYGPNGSFSSRSQYCQNNNFGVLTSALSFSCVPCPVGTYAVKSGVSDGTPNSANTFPCLPCPDGGLCPGGTVKATTGRWGAADSDGVVSLALCPPGYCCSSTDGVCASVDGCDGSRTGMLCGACLPGFVEGIGASACVPVGQCGKDLPAVWTCVVVGVLFAAFAQLAIVSDVWFPSRAFPAGKLKLFVYFFQVR